jgi:hypothetical protein
MKKEWFTLAELRAAKVAGVDDDFCRALARRFDRLPERKARRRVGTINAEFHVSCLSFAMREHLEAVFFPGSVSERIIKLGIWRPVVAESLDDEISMLEAMLAERRERRAA